MKKNTVKVIVLVSADVNRLHFLSPILSPEPVCLGGCVLGGCVHSQCGVQPCLLGGWSTELHCPQ